MSSAIADEGEIFIVDDDPAVRDALRLVFELEGYKVAAFPDGVAFLTAAKVRTPSCVILDVHMPGRSGLDVLSELGPNYAAPIFMISGQGDIPMAVEAIKHGAHDFIEKPFDADTVVERVREAIAARQRNSKTGAEAILGSFLGEISSRRASGRCWSGSRSAPPTRRPVGSSASVRARSRCTGPHHGETRRAQHGRPRAYRVFRGPPH